MKRRLIAALLVCMCCSAALGEEISLLPGVDLTGLYRQAVRLDLQLQYDEYMPLGEERVADLNRLLRHISLRGEAQTAGDTQWERLALRFDGEELFSLTQRTDSAGVAAVASPTDLAWLQLAGSEVSVLPEAGDPLIGMNGTEWQWYEDLTALVSVTLQDWEEQIKTRKGTNTVVGGYGTTKLVRTLTIAKADTEAWQAYLREHCPEGELRRLLQEVTLSGKQTVTMYTLEDGTLRRLAYTGNAAATDGTTRKVTLIWRTEHTDTRLRDDISFKTPATKGKNRDTVKLSRDQKLTEEGQVQLSLTASHDAVRGKQRTQRGVELNLTGSGGALNGECTLTRKLSGDLESDEELRLTPDVRVEDGALCGTVAWNALTGGELSSAGRAEVRLESVQPDWQMPQGVPALTEEAAQAAQETMTLAIASALVRRAALLPEEDTLFFSRGLSEWPEIVRRARELQ